jgi:hypothetical protein
MSTLDEIAARDQQHTDFPPAEVEEEWSRAAMDRRYLLGLVREAREALECLADSCDVWAEDDPAVQLIARLTEKGTHV